MLVLWVAVQLKDVYAALCCISMIIVFAEMIRLYLEPTLSSTLSAAGDMVPLFKKIALGPGRNIRFMGLQCRY